MSKIALITGITGQDGPYLANLLLSKNYIVYGLVSRRSTAVYDNLSFLGINDRINYITGDLTDLSSIRRAIEISKPDEIYNLAAMSFVGASWDIAIHTSNVNSIGVLNILECIRSLDKGIKFYQAGTSEMFGSNINSNGYQDENTPFHPRSPYGVSKVFAHNMVQNYRESFGIFACNGVLFNHESPLRGKEFVTRKITSGIANILAKNQDRIELGNLSAERDWGFAGDYVDAMWLMLQKDTPDDYVIATGQTNSIQYFLETAFEYSGLGSWTKYVSQNPKHFRPAEVNKLKGDSSKAAKVLGWKPKINLDALIKMMIDADVKRLING
jgi:GDPmannose 4,6-dehydratase